MPHDTRDAIIDYVRDWSGKSDIPASLVLRWVGITSSKYHDWKKRFGKVNEHNASVPRDHWLTDDEKARIHTFARAQPYTPATATQATSLLAAASALMTPSVMTSG